MYKIVIKILSVNKKLKSIGLIFLLLLVSLLEVLGIGILIPVFKVLFDDEFTSKIGKEYEVSKNLILIFLCIIMLMFFLIKNFIIISIENFKQNFVYSVFEEVSNMFLVSYFKKGLLFMQKESSTVLFKNIYSIPLFFATNIVLGFFVLFSELIILTFLSLGLIYINYSLFFLLIVGIGPLLFLFYKITKAKTLKVGDAINTITPKVHESVNDIVFGHLDIVVYQKENWFKNNYKKLLSQFKNVNIERQMLYLYPSKLIDILVVVCLVGIILFGLFYKLPSSQILILLISFGLISMKSIPSINKINAAFMSMRSNYYTVDIINEIINEKHDNNLDREEQIDVKFCESIELRNVNFGYTTNKLVLKSINIEIKKGSTVGVIGGSGSGKTTLISLIAQLYRLNSGAIYIDDVEINENNTKSWQKKIGYVSQNVFILNDSLKKNIAFGNDIIDNEKLNKCIEEASLSSFVKDNGLDFNLGENGEALSGGQKQRVGIARALYSGAKVFLFDEATSALDNSIEREIMESIKSLSEIGYTIIIVAHRLSTLADCDKIIKLENGSVEGEYLFSDIYNER